MNKLMESFPMVVYNDREVTLKQRGKKKMVLVKAQMAGTVFEVSVKEGEAVAKGQTVIILESMKMEIPHDAMVDGHVAKVLVAEGDFVEEDDVLVEIS